MLEIVGEAKSMLREFIVASIAALAFASLGSGAQAQPVGSFADIAGKWEGTTSFGTKTTIEIDASGKFQSTTSRGPDSGTAKIDGGLLIIPISGNQGNYWLTRTGNVLAGPIHYRGLEATVRFERAGK
jgi:hypothetical protein